MSKEAYRSIIPDEKNKRGKWAKTVVIGDIRASTLSYSKWKAMNRRCTENGYQQLKSPTYVGCKNEFEDFQEFVEWSRQQVGYGDRTYDLDKDLLIKGNKIYSPETCVFLPHSINMLLIKAKAVRGNYPIGVSYHKRDDNYIAQCSSGKGILAYLGYHDTPESAFQAYKSYKENLVRKVAEEYKNIIDPRAYQVLMNYQVEITD